MRRQNYASALN